MKSNGPSESLELYITSTCDNTEPQPKRISHQSEPRPRALTTRQENDVIIIRDTAVSAASSVVTVRLSLFEVDKDNELVVVQLLGRRRIRPGVDKIVGCTPPPRP